MRLNVAVARVTERGLPLVYVNQVGGQDELVFDGASFVLNADLHASALQLAGVSRDGGDGGVRARRRRLALQRRPAGASWRPATRPIMRPACWACATT